MDPLYSSILWSLAPILLVLLCLMCTPCRQFILFSITFLIVAVAMLAFLQQLVAEKLIKNDPYILLGLSCIAGLMAGLVLPRFIEAVVALLLGIGVVVIVVLLFLDSSVLQDGINTIGTKDFFFNKYISEAPTFMVNAAWRSFEILNHTLTPLLSK